jgi:glycosyltransferase involved in cell wall biosynthesis
MIIGIDGNEANVKNRVGIGEYALELLMQFYNFQFPISNFQFTIYLKAPPLAHMPKEREGWKYKVIGPRRLWTRFALPLRLFTQKHRPDVFFTPTHYGPWISPMPTAISIMDLSFLHFPGLFNKKDLYQLTNWTLRSVKQSKKIFTISEFSKNDIIKTYGIEPGKVVVTYPGIKEDLRFKIKDLRMDELKKKYKIDRPFILFVGTLQPRKNIAKLIEAFAMLKNQKTMNNEQESNMKELELVIIGKKGWLYEEILEAPKKFSVEDRVKFLDFVGDDDLPSFYKNALCFCLPSLYEGFGLPVLEAMQLGCPVLTSNVSSLPEAGGDAAIYFNPEDASDIAEKLKLVINDEGLRIKMREKGYNQIKKFSWEKAAKQTLSVLQELGSKK